jgi:hypothetical protein
MTDFVPMHLQQFVKHIEKSFERTGSKNISIYLGEPSGSDLAELRKHWTVTKEFLGYYKFEAENIK